MFVEEKITPFENQTSLGLKTGLSTPFDVHLQWFGDDGSDEGQGNQEDVSDEGQGDLPPETPQSFYEWEEPDGEGKKYTFTSPDELSNYLKENHYRRSKFTQDMQGLAEQRRSFENDRTSFHSQRSEFEERYKELKEYDEYLKSNPSILAKLQEFKRQGMQSQDIDARMDAYFQKKYGKDIEDLKAYKSRELLAKQKQEAENALKAKYPEYDSTKVQEAFDNLQRGDLSVLLEMLHFSNKGRLSPVELEKKILQNQAKKKSAGLITSQGNTNSLPPNAPKTIDEARAKAYKEYSGG